MYFFDAKLVHSTTQTFSRLPILQIFFSVGIFFFFHFSIYLMKLEIGDPPYELESNEVVVKVIKNRGNTFEVLVPQSKVELVKNILPDASDELLVGLSPRLRNQYFIKRGGYAVATIEQRGKLQGEISNVCGDERQWQKQSYWPEEYKTSNDGYDALDLPPSEDEFETEEEEEEEEEPAVQFLS